MKLNANPRGLLRTITRHAFVFPAGCVAAFLILTAAARAQTDNFDGGPDAAWQKSDTATYPGTFSFVSDVFGGKAYRLQGFTPTTSGTPGLQTTARAVAVRTDQSYSSSFYVAADLVAWNTSVYDPTNEAVIGLIARASNVTTPEQLQGIIFATHYNQYGNAVEGTRGTAQIYGVLQGGAFVIPAAQGNFTITPGHSYRMVFTGTNNIFYGRFYDLEDLTHPLLTLFGDDQAAPGFFPTSGYSGLFTLGYRGSASAVNDTTCDATYDNFVAAEVPPASVAAPAVPHGMVGVPQVVNRSPASYANFYAPAGGITFNATTLTTTNSIKTNAIRLVLNGVNVSSSLAITGPTTNASVSFSGLSANCFYSGRIELEDALGRHTTNCFTFDTFSDAYLASSAAKNIECEEYDFADVGYGKFYDNPVVSGYTTNVPPDPVRVGEPNTYAAQIGANANPNAFALEPFDFFDWDTRVNADDADFRISDAIGTQNGTLEFAFAWQVYGQYNYWRGYDTLRQKYLSARPDGSLVECGVERTEGSEWLNYTRVFNSANVYNVYLRYGCNLTQGVSLDQIGPEPSTNNIGTFDCPGALSRANFCYAPLRDSSGKLATLNLSQTNTLRLTLTSPRLNGTKNGLWLNSLALVPAVPQVYSASNAAGPYTPETSMLVDTTNRRLTVPQNGAARYYRVGWKSQVQITGITLSGDNVVLTYQ
jgi:hypothetical protein